MKSFFAITVLIVSLFRAHAFEFDTRPRLLVLTDIGGDPDDQQSLVRLLVYASEFKIEGLIATAFGTPGELKRAVVQPELIREQIEAYARVYPNLTNHAGGYPTPEHLLSVVKSGNPERGREAIGDGGATEGSQFIVELGTREDRRPLNIAIWGGQTDLAQACWDVRRKHGYAGLKKFLSRIRVHDIADQDGIFEWMHGEFDFSFYILDKARPGQDKREAVFRGMYLGGDESLTSREWVEMNVRTGHGPLGELYPPKTWTAPNPHATIKEGDTPSWLYFLPHGLNDPTFPTYGGWGGRFELVDGVWRDARDSVDGITNGRTTVSRWRRSFQNDFEARMDWCVNNFYRANHAPLVVVGGDSSKDIIRVKGTAGKKIELRAKNSFDPDADKMTFRWSRYWEPGTFRGELRIKNSRSATCEFEIPTVTQSRTIHLILEVTDDGEPALTSFRRVVVEALPTR